jgi:modification methylase
MTETLPLDKVLVGDCREHLGRIPAGSIDLVFADPPYNLQLRGNLYRPNLSRVDAVNDEWDQFDTFEAYDVFTREWLRACRRVLKPKGALWVIGSYHNIYRVGKILMDEGYWILNDVVWIKTNPMPNFRGVRFTNAHETLVWAARSADQKGYTFNYKAMKALNGGRQMRSDWEIPLCTGPERIRINGNKAHSTQKPEALLTRVIRACSRRGDVVLDPFMGSGTTGAVCQRYGRHYIGIELDPAYADIARERIAAVEALPPDDLDVADVKPARIAFQCLVDANLLLPGQELRFDRTGPAASVLANGKLAMGEETASIHRMGARASGAPACNGWEHWYYTDAESRQWPIDRLRQMIRDAE